MILALLSYFGANVSGGAAATAAGTATGTIGTSWPSAGAEQNLGVRSIPINRRGGSSGAASVQCTTVNGSAVAGKDFTAINSVITWASGDAADKGCNVTISNATPFTGLKAFYVRLSNAKGAPLGTSQTLVLIYGDKDGGLISLSAPTYTASQSAGAVTITVNRTNGASGYASVSYATANGTAIAGTNYTSTHGGLSWGKGDASPKSFVIPINKSAAFTGSKTVAIALAGAAGASLGSTKSAMVSINGAAAAAPTSGSATLSWTAPTLDADGSPVTNLTGYNIYYGKSATTMSSVINVNNPASGSHVIGNLTSGTWYFGIKAYNSQADESAFSPIVSKTM